MQKAGHLNFQSLNECVRGNFCVLAGELMCSSDWKVDNVCLPDMAVPDVSLFARDEYGGAKRLVLVKVDLCSILNSRCFYTVPI